jgi:hypothetical protein
MLDAFAERENDAASCKIKQTIRIVKHRRQEPSSEEECGRDRRREERGNREVDDVSATDRHPIQYQAT